MENNPQQALRMGEKKKKPVTFMIGKYLNEVYLIFLKSLLSHDYILSSERQARGVYTSTERDETLSIQMKLENSSK